MPSFMSCLSDVTQGVISQASFHHFSLCQSLLGGLLDALVTRKGQYNLAGRLLPRRGS